METIGLVASLISLAVAVFVFTYFRLYVDYFYVLMENEYVNTSRVVSDQVTERCSRA